MTVQTLRMGRCGHCRNSSRIQEIEVGLVIGARISDRNARIVDIDWWPGIDDRGFRGPVNWSFVSQNFSSVNWSTGLDVGVRPENGRWCDGRGNVRRNEMRRSRGHWSCAKQPDIGQLCRSYRLKPAMYLTGFLTL